MSGDALETPTATLREPAGFDRYRAYMAPLWDIHADIDPAAPFDWATRLHHLGRAVVGRARAPGHVSERTDAHAARMGIDHLLVVARNSGRADIDLDPGERRSVGNAVSFLDLSRPFRASVTEVDVITLALPRALIAPLVPDVDSLHGAILRQDTPLGALAWAHLNTLADTAPGLPGDAVTAVIDATAALLAACAAPSAPRGDARVRARPAVLLTIRRFISSNLGDPALDATTIAQRFCLSRSTIYRLFQSLGGVENYIRRQRLAQAFRMLVATRSREGSYVYQVASACGFRSDSAFSHAFRREYGQTPRDLLVNGAPGPAMETGAGIARWLDDLA